MQRGFALLTLGIRWGSVVPYMKQGTSLALQVALGELQPLQLSSESFTLEAARV